MTSSTRVVAGLLLGLAGGCGERAIEAPVAPAPEPAPAAASRPAPPITAAAMVDTPVCLGFMPGGGAAYILTTDHDRSIAEWYVKVEVLGGGWSDLEMMARTSAPDVAQREFAALVEPINALVRKYEMVACTTTLAGPDQPLEVDVRGTRTTISYRHGDLVVAPEGKPPVVRPQTETEDLSLIAAYTAPTSPLVAVVMRDSIAGGVVTAERAEWIMVDSPAAIAK